MPPPTSEPGDRIATGLSYNDAAGRPPQGGAVAVVAELAKLAIHLGAIMLLARLLAPDAFGLVAIVVVLLAFLELVRDLGLSTGASNRTPIDHAEVNALFWANIAASVVAFLAFCALAPLLAGLFGRAELTEIAIWLAAGLLPGALASQHLGLLRRQMRLAALAVAEIVAAVVGIVVAVVVATMDGGVWALVAQRLAWSGTLALAAWSLCNWRPGPPAGLVALRPLAGFGGGVALSSVARLAGRTVDHALIGWMWGASALGFYTRAQGLLTVPIRSVDTPMMMTAMPLLDRLRERPQRYRRTYLRMFEAVCMVSMPVAALLAAAPDWVVAVLLGPQWTAATGIALWLAVAALCQPATNTAAWLLVSQGRAADLTYWNVTGAAIRIVAIMAGLPFGAVGVAAACAVSGVAVRMPLLFWMAGRRGPVSTRDLYAAMSASMIAAGAVFGAVWGARRIPGMVPADPVTALGAALCLGLLVALVCFVGLPRGRRALREARSVTLSLFGVEARP